MTKSVQILGVTGSVGTSTASIILEHREEFCVDNIVADRNWEKLAQQAIELRAKNIVIAQEKYYEQLKSTLSGHKIKVHAGKSAMLELAREKYDVTVSSIVGLDGLEPTMEAVKGSSIVALGNKESIVCAGPLLLSAALRYDSTIIPIDSEHSALFQVLERRNKDAITKMTLTGSGGPFRNRSLDDMMHVTKDEALRHPTWSMGSKISIDCATMMNKALEVIEAHQLFNISYHLIDIVIHPESVVHGLIEYTDGSTLAHLGMPNMRTPIAYALFYPTRGNIAHQPLNLSQLGSLNFSSPDYRRFPLLKLALDVAHEGEQSRLVIMNAANEKAVELFLREQISYMMIHQSVERTLQRLQTTELSSIQDILKLHAAAKALTEEQF
ncbi:1-deoxy-D-xylulose-5-phosphate reductoisomerase [Rickettsiales endosymbiont of Peranema trichophorum]|uniref:1-deoxy-D-xylulose-5-phosphate reductoisomerase n=1 Tax=Rickettsiales endosymbiont of Peranema trichophorum TaxID=2486577 RepID=UPI0013EEDAEA|nr:1-deoxy-D-xylulose-5-phosphate reductoisomerase [Rickettsiales endosymbiont of Peranema trichophorum]